MVIAESFERIHRSNLVGMGVLPLQFAPGQNVASLALTGQETFELIGLADAIKSDFAHGKELQVRTDTGKSFMVTCRIDTPQEIQYYRHGGILLYVLRSLV